MAPTSSPPRIVSLLPATTEIACALGLEPVDPDVVVLVPCGFTLDRVLAEILHPGRFRFPATAAFASPVPVATQ